MRDIDELAVRINQTARSKGFWDKERNMGEMLMLATSELAEALEEDRVGNPAVWFQHGLHCELAHMVSQGVESPLIARLAAKGEDGCTCIPKPEGALVELMDAVIRCLDTGQHLASMTRYTAGQVMEMKMEYNDSREHMHGKAY